MNTERQLVWFPSLISNFYNFQNAKVISEGRRGGLSCAREARGGTLSIIASSSALGSLCFLILQQPSPALLRHGWPAGGLQKVLGPGPWSLSVSVSLSVATSCRLPPLFVLSVSMLVRICESLSSPPSLVATPFPVVIHAGRLSRVVHSMALASLL